VGTPYILGASLKGAGADCATLLAEYLQEIGAADDIETGLYSADWFCHGTSERYLRALMRHAKQVASTYCRMKARPQPGDIVLFKLTGSKLYNHGAIITEWPMGIHAAASGVKEVDLTRNSLTAFRTMDVFDPFGD